MKKAIGKCQYCREFMCCLSLGVCMRVCSFRNPWTNNTCGDVRDRGRYECVWNLNILRFFTKRLLREPVTKAPGENTKQSSKLGTWRSLNFWSLLSVHKLLLSSKCYSSISKLILKLLKSSTSLSTNFYFLLSVTLQFPILLFFQIDP